MWILVHNGTEVCSKFENKNNAAVITNGIKLEFETEQLMKDEITELNLIDTLD